MNAPVYEHTVIALRSIIHNENEPLQNISHLLKYDPGLYFSLLKYINSSDKRNDITSISQAITLIGAEGAERFILQQQDAFLDERYHLLWCYAVLAGETAALINERVDLADEDEAFFAGLLPSIGMLLMLEARSSYSKILELLLKVPLEHRVFIEAGLYKSTLIAQLDRNLSAPKVYRDIADLMAAVFSEEGRRRNHLEHPAKLSIAYKSFQLFRLLDAADTAARALLFPAVVEAQEKFRELCKRYFRIPENEIEELMADVMERFEAVCQELNVGELPERFFGSAESYVSPGITFLTKSESLKRVLDEAYAAAREDKNIFIYGESSVGKRLLSVALHRHADNPRQTKPFLAIHCSTLDSETFEMELFGAKGGFLGFEKHKGALELANGGIILLKDIDALPPMLQDRLADILTNDEFYKIGETHPASFDIKFIVTSRVDIVRETREGRFSERLLTAINPVSIPIPPLRERREDIEFIADSIIEKYNLNLTDKALRLGLHEYYDAHAFPDNLRDLKRLLFFLSAKHSLKP
ncbi:MAG: sigma 54-interacting transcriptional regulator [Nitrospirota bacterium]